MASFLTDLGRRKGEDVEGNALSWDEEAEKLIQEDTKTKQNCFCCDCIWRYTRGKELSHKKEQIKKLMETGKELAIGLPALPPDVERYSSQDYIHFKSRESKYKELLEALNDDNNYIVGLHGMEGIGKTTLAKEVGKKLKQSKQFTQVVDTTVSFPPDIKKIQDDIAGPLGLKFDECNESDRPKKLWSRLTNGEKILLILDDVWGDIDFDEIGIPNINYHKGCRILVTTCNLFVCKKLGFSKTIKLDLLSEQDAWIMFQRYADLSELLTTNLLDKGRKIANECKRLPSAIATIASSLKGEQRLRKWDVALNSLKKPASVHGVDDNVVQIDKRLLFSYDYMKDDKAKGLFLLCSVFPENEEISIERLTRLCIGVGLFGEDYGSYHDDRNLVVAAKNKLLDSGLLLEAGQSGVKMYDLVRDAAQWLANEQIQTINLHDKNQKAMVERGKNIKYLLFQGKLKDVFSCKLDGSKLEILICIVDKDEDYQNMKIEVLNSFFDNNIGLRVFHLFYDHYPKLRLSLPQSIQSLKNIRSLLFTCVDLADISILGNLPSLETLDLNDCKTDELPHGIANLKKFRLLNLEGCEIERNNPFEVIKECSSLEELYFTGSFNAFCQEITFPKLQRFCIDEFSRLGNDSSSKYVSVLDKDGVFLSETTLKYCMQTAEVLRIRTIDGGWRNLIPEIVSSMTDMVELSLSCISQLQYLIDTKHTNFQLENVLSNLVVLELDRMENLEKLFNGPISLDLLENLERLSIKDCKKLRSLFNCKLNLCNLKTIKVQNCPMLVSLFQPLTSRSLVLLEKLQISNCEGLVNILSDEIRDEESKEEIDDGDDNDNKSRGSMFPRLKVIDIEECPQLQYIHPFLSTQILKNLEKLSIKDCKHLRSLSKCKLNLCNLKTIKVQNCLMLVSLFQPLTSRSLVLLEKVQIANCEGLENILSGEKREKESIEEIDDGDDNDNKTGGSLFPMLKVLDIEECPRLQYILPFLPTQGRLVLEAIRIRRCDELKYIFGQYHSMFLRRLRIWERLQCLPIQSYSMCNIKEINLSHFFMIKSVFILSITPRMLLETLTVTNCDELRSIIIDSEDQDNGGNNWGAFPKLKRINIGDCIKLEYIFGHYTHDHQNHNEVQLNLPALKHINLCNLPSLVAMSTKQYHTTCPLSVELEHNGCSQVAIKSFQDFIIQPISKSKGIEISVEEGSTSTNAQTITSPTHFEFLCSSSGQLIAPEHKITSHDDGDDKIAMTSFSIATTETNDQGENALLLCFFFSYVTSNILEKFPKDYDIIFTESPVASHFSMVPDIGDPSQKVEDLSSLLVKTELEQLVSKKHLDYENLSLLTDFLVKHPLAHTTLNLWSYYKMHATLVLICIGWMHGVERRTLLPNLQV
ncbi:putative disease resistance protein [Trifolium repens]|nr:putative disease resistance protein [Trifolium repens]